MVIDGEYHLTGVITNGDILRWMTRQNEPNLKIAYRNSKYWFSFYHKPLIKKRDQGTLRKVQYLPVINDQNQLISIYSNQPQSLLEIGKSLIGENQPAYVIAEIINHNGSHEILNALMEKAAVRFDAVKVQLRVEFPTQMYWRTV